MKLPLLTTAQHKVLLAAGRSKSKQVDWKMTWGTCYRALQIKGLIDHDGFLTPLGLATYDYYTSGQ